MDRPPERAFGGARPVSFGRRQPCGSFPESSRPDRGKGLAVSPTSTNNVTVIDTKRGLTPRAEGRAGSGDADPIIRARLAALLDKAAGRGAGGNLELALKEE